MKKSPSATARKKMEAKAKKMTTAQIKKDLKHLESYHWNIYWEAVADDSRAKWNWNDKDWELYLEMNMIETVLEIELRNREHEKGVRTVINGA